MINLTGIFKKDYIIGLDIGSSSVKVAVFQKKEDGLHLVKGALKNANEEKEVIQAIEELSKGIDLKKSKVIASINCPKTSIKVVKIPYMPKSELKDGIMLEAKNYFPFPIDDSMLDYEILGDVVEKGVRKYEVAVAVSPKATVDKYLSILRKAGVKPASFISCPLALQKLAENLHYGKEKTTALVDIGENHTELVILKGKAIMFNRKLPVTGEEFTKSLTSVLVSDRGKTQLSPQEAEKIKVEVGMPSGEESKIIDDKISTTQVLSMLRTPLENLASEIERCFDYYREETQGGKVDSAVLLGGGSALSGLTGFLSESLGLEVTLGDPLEGLKVDQKAVSEREKISYRLGPAIGAALSEAKGVNLLPSEIKEEAKRFVARGTIEVFASAIIIISILFYVGLRIQLKAFDRKISAVRMELASLQIELKKAEAYHLAGMVLVDEPHWEDSFREMSHIIPENMYFTNVVMKNKIITMKGIVASERGEEVLSDFILNMEKGIFKNVKLVHTMDLDDRPGNEFEIKCWVD